MLYRGLSVSRPPLHAVKQLLQVTTLLGFTAAAAIALPPSACVVPDNGSGTADLPPLSCAYVSLEPLHIIDGLPPGTTVECDATMDSFFDIAYFAGGVHGGQIEQFKAQLQLDLTGTGALAGYFRPAFFDVFCESHSAPRTPGDPVQSFAHELVMLQGQLPPGDPDFDLLRITGGTGFGLPSPGHTTLAAAPGGNWSVDSFFDITYRIDFIGHPGGPFGGQSGSTTGTIRMQCGGTPPVGVESSAWGSVKSLYRATAP
jgi:hypothetical protein